MLEDISTIDLRIISLYSRDYSSTFSIMYITKILDINYPNAFKRIKRLVNQKILLKNKVGQANNISLNIQNIEAIQLLCFVEEMEGKKIKNTILGQLVKEVIQTDPFSCIGLFGSRASGRATKESDWDVFIISQKEKRRKLEKIASKFPHAKNLQLQVFSIKEFQDSLLTSEETVVKYIVRNKKIIYNPHPFYSIIYNWERIKYAPSQ